MTTRTSALGLNACAVALLQQGMCHEASSFLLQAIHHFTDSDSPLQRNVVQGQEQRTSFHVVPTNILDQQVCTLELSFSPGNAFQFFNKSFLIDLGDVYDKQSDYANVAQDQMAAVLWYNWGVTYHYAAISRGQSKYLEKALGLYTEAFRMLIQNNAVVNDSMVLLLLSVCNNMGYCSYHTGGVTVSRCCHDYIISILGTHTHDSCFEQEYEFFYSPWNSRTIMSIAPAA
jgi:hypothetical protein